MLAPRKKLWTTPKEVLVEALHLLLIQENDIVYDIGCGDGNFLFLCLEEANQKFFNRIEKSSEENSIPFQVIGVDIEEERVQSIHQRLEEMKVNEIYPPEVFNHIQAIHSNALDLPYSNGTCFYLYLIPRGLKQVLQILVKNISHPFRIATYMYQIPGFHYNKMIKVHSEKHDGSQWPVYYYEIDPSNISNVKNSVDGEEEVVKDSADA